MIKDVIKDFFIPHEGNNHHPHFLHSKRAVFYSSFFVAIKLIVFVSVAFLPVQAFLSPDILVQQKLRLEYLIKDFQRQQLDLVPFSVNNVLETSALARSHDMDNKDYFSHVSPDGDGLATFLKQAEYRYKTAGENLAMGFSSADAVMNAWLRSPLHRQNLVDSDFSQMGLGITEGQYKDRYTIFITHHFGRPRVEQKSRGAELDIFKQIDDYLAPEEVLGTRITKADTVVTIKSPIEKTEELEYFSDQSNVFWTYNGEETTLTAKAVIIGETSEVFVDTNDVRIELAYNAEDNTYTGQTKVVKPIDDFFNVVVSPTITILGASGDSVVSSIEWFNIKVVQPSITDRYFTAKYSLSGIISYLFSFSSIVYAIALVIFIVALLLNIFIQMHKQHPHVIGQTFLVIFLLTLLLVI